MKPVAYLAGLDSARMFLWSGLIWYLTMSLRHPPVSAVTWLQSAGIAFVVGAILLANTSESGGAPRPRKFWPTARLFIIPFCVSSFSMTMHASGLVLIFSREMRDNLWGLAAVSSFLLLCRAARLNCPVPR